MSLSPARLAIAVVKPTVFLKIAGWANSTASVDFRTALYELRQCGYTQFVLDLTDCSLMDSTFVGVLAGFSLKLGRPNAGSATAIQLVNPNARITDSLDNLGIAHLFCSTQGPPPQAAYEPSPASKPEPSAVTRTSLEAHQALMAIAPANIPKFKELAQFLSEDLKRRAGQLEPTAG